MFRKQVTTDARLLTAERNRIVYEADIQCHAKNCTTRANRWSNLCGRCEAQYLNWSAPIFGKPDADHMNVAKDVLKEHFEAELESGTFRLWVRNVAKAMSRPESLAIAPLKIKDMRSPRERVEHLLAWRAKGRYAKSGVQAQSRTVGYNAILNLLAFALCIDTFISPHIFSPLRQNYMLTLLGRRFIGHPQIGQTKMRLRTKLVKTGYILSDRTEEVRRVEYEEPEGTAYRVRRSDLRRIGKLLWQSIEKNFLSTGGRRGAEWESLKDKLRLKLRDSHS